MVAAAFSRLESDPAKLDSAVNDHIRVILRACLPVPIINKISEQTSQFLAFLPIIN